MKLIDDKVFVKGKRVQKRTQFSVIIYHKQKGEIVSKKTIVEEKLYMIPCQDNLVLGLA